MSIIKTIRNAALAACVYLAAACSPIKTADIEFKPGYNALETAVSDEGNLVNRLWLNDDVQIGSVEVGYNGLNELVNCDGSTYYGDHRFTVSAGPLVSHAEAVIQAQTDSQGVFDTKVGIRNESLLEMLKGYGFLDVLANKEAANITLLYGKPLPKGFSVEVFHSTELPFDGSPTHYTELQLNKELREKLLMFIRASYGNFDAESGAYAAGVTCTF